MSRLALQLIKLIAYFVLVYIPLLLVCVVVSTGIAAFIVQSIDYCYGSMACLGHGIIIFAAGVPSGFLMSCVIAIYAIHYRYFNTPKQKRKTKNPL